MIIDKGIEFQKNIHFCFSVFSKFKIHVDAFCRVSLIAQLVKNPPAMQDTPV